MSIKYINMTRDWPGIVAVFVERFLNIVTICHRWLYFLRSDLNTLVGPQHLVYWPNSDNTFKN